MLSPWASCAGTSQRFGHSSGLRPGFLGLTSSRMNEIFLLHWWAESWWRMGLGAGQVCRHPFSSFLEANVRQAEGCCWWCPAHLAAGLCPWVLLSGGHVSRRAQARTGSRCRCERLGPGFLSFPLPCCKIGQTQGLVFRKSPIMGWRLQKMGIAVVFFPSLQLPPQFPPKDFFPPFLRVQQVGFGKALEQLT